MNTASRSTDGPSDEVPAAERRPSTLGRLAMQVLWPAFLVAVVAEGLLFSMIDPQELTIVGLHLADSREATYSVGFFLFWALFSLSSGLTWWLAKPDDPPPDGSAG
ncbi:MAG TPA: hypothetical protein PKA20_13535 [Burkholderiaceae bacterium]|nr:hypothetical protein [Burkholderiaceae bacterium]